MWGHRLHEGWALLKRTAHAFVRSDPFGQAGAIAYSTIFALPAVLIITLVLASLFYDPVEVRKALYDQAGSLIGMDTATSLREIVEHARHQTSTVFARVVGIATLIFSATSVFMSVQGSLNRIWNVKPVPGRAIVKYFISRLLSLALIASFGFLLLVSLVIDAGLVAFGARLEIWFPDFSVILLAAANVLISFLVIGVVFALAFKLLPDARVKWRDVRSGALLTAVLFTAGKYLIGFYIGSTHVDDAYGAAGTVIVILLWVYFSAVILLFGAQFTYQVAEQSGRTIKPSEHAVVDHSKDPQNRTDGTHQR
ncbi:MAG TPA: YihY/virulence factor BrkB family protein [Flavobacteriales bacterium]|nr:YihY/virulence factor BrkB family protein [Flavobacteriales bacterium]